MKIHFPIFHNSLRTGLSGYLAVVFTMSSVFLTILLVSVIGMTASRELKHTIGMSLSQRAVYSAEKLDTSMYERYREVENLSRRLEIASSTISNLEKQAILNQVQSTYPYYAWMGITDNDGKILAATQGMLVGGNAAKKNWFINEKAGVNVHDVHDAVMLAKLIPSKDGEPVRFVDIAFSFRGKNGNRAGMLGAHLSWEWAKETRDLIFMDASAKTDFMIVAHDGTVLLGPANLLGKAIATTSFAEASQRKTGYLEEKWPDGRSYLVGYAKTSGYRTYPGLGWTVLTRQDASSAYLPVYRMQIKVFWIGMAIALLFSLLGMFIARRISRPIMQVAQSAMDIESGKATVLGNSGHSYYEAEALTSALNSLLRNLHSKEQSLTDMNMTLESRVTQRTNELQAERSLLNTVLDSINVGVVVCNEQSRLTLFNRASRELLGEPLESLPPESWAQHYRLFEPDGATPMLTEHIPLVRTMAGEIIQDVEMIIAPLGQSPRLLLSSGRHLTDPYGRHLGGVIVFNDITERREVEQTLAENAKLLRTITNGISARVSYIDAKMRYRFSNDHYAATAGCQPEQMIGKTVREIFGDQVYASHAPHMARVLRGDRVSFDRQVNENGVKRFLHYEYTPDTTETGRIMGFFALITDVTGIKEAQMEIASKERLLRGVTDHLPALVSFIDLQGRFQFNNAPYEQWLQKPLSQITGKTQHDLYTPEEFALKHPFYLKAVSGERCDFEFISSRLGPERHYSATYMPQLDMDGEVLGVCGMVHDITDLKRAEEQMRRLARIDNLTGLPNRAQFQERLTQAMARGQRNHTLMALLFLDIDKFKAINDTLGHRGGDLVLKEFGARLLTCVRKTDMVARLAGDEFVIILEGMVSVDEATVVAQKIVESMMPAFAVGTLTWQVSTSIGIALRENDNHDGERLLHHADEALYAAKAAGRNTYRVHNGDSK